MDDVKREIELKIIQPLLRPELYRAYGKSIGGGILLYGPPGCGKTLLARATAGQVNARFLCISISDVLDMWVGNSERNLARFFAAAREHKPSVLFFDEVDALGSRRNDLHGNMRMVVNQFLQELDGARGSNDGLLVLAATNAPWHLDPAFRRPGRFDRMIFVPPPDEAARASILEVLLRGKPQQSIDFAKLAKKSGGHSGADLYGAIDRAVEHKLAEALRTGRPDPLSTKDVLAAIEKQAPSTREWFATAKNYVLYANEGGVYDDVARWMKEHRA
jgi:SpoVK/Ycf46/Vps4 family AAA+-type ATPase